MLIIPCNYELINGQCHALFGVISRCHLLPVMRYIAILNKVLKIDISASKLRSNPITVSLSKQYFFTKKSWKFNYTVSQKNFPPLNSL